MRIVLHKGHPVRINTALAERLRKAIARKGVPDAADEQRLVQALLPFFRSANPAISFEALYNFGRAAYRFVGDDLDRLRNLDRISNTLYAEALFPLGADVLRNYLVQIFAAMGIEVSRDQELRNANLGYPLSVVTAGAAANAALFATLVVSLRVPKTLWEIRRIGLHLAPATEGQDPQALRTYADQIWERIQLARRYGLKHCQFEAASLVGAHDQLVVVSGEDLSPSLRQSIGDRVFALMMLSTYHPDVDSICVDPLALVEAIGDLSGQLDVPEELRTRLVDRCFWTVRDRGHLHLFDTRVRCDRVMAAYGCVGSYELLRLLILNRLHDLVVPVEVADALPDLASGEADLISAPTGEARQRAVQAMVMPRLQLSGSVYTRGEGALRTFRRHDVVWHIRRLPNGYRPSRQAQDLAKEFGVTLGEHETFVRSHERGTGEESPPVREVKFDR